MPDPYNYTFDKDTDSYNFITKNNIEYKIAFIVDETLNIASVVQIENIYQIIIEKITDKKECYDSSFSKTIEHIVIAFFANVQNSLIYVCSQDDEKAEKRFKVFNRWYDNCTLEFVTKVDNVINFESDDITYTLFTSLLYHVENPNIEYILEAYYKIKDAVNDK